MSAPSTPTAPSPVRAGLDDVVAVETRLSRVDGEAGELVIAGQRVEDLAANHGFEATCHLLWHGALPSQDGLAHLRQELGRRRVEVHRRLAAHAAPPLSDPMDGLRAALAGLASAGDPRDDALTLVAAVPVAVAAWWARRDGGDAPAPDPDLATAADYLRMLLGPAPEPAAARALERYLVTVSDHGMNASTFAARVVASTRSDAVSAVVAAVGALKGPLHGGAPGPVLDMLDAVGKPGNAEAWIRDELDAGRRIMGMGHRVYRVRDPRAAVFEDALRELGDGEDSPRVALARAVEAAAERLLEERHPGRRLKANVEFYTALLLERVGAPRALFTPTFAVGRVAGWTAHVLEQREQDRLIRPRSRYVGPEPR